MTYQERLNAREVFGIGERATLRTIRERHRELVMRHHPDRDGQADPGEIQRINAAWRILSEYCGNYAYLFSEQEFLEQRPEERLRRQFDQDPSWGGLYRDK